jgi:hypothetical protein
MPDFENKNIPLPEKHDGSHKDIEATTEANTVEEAKSLFIKVKRRLLDVNNWNKLCGKASADFTLTDANGRQVDGPPEVGFHFKIDVPGPGSASGDGFDWVQVEAIEEGHEVEQDREFIVVRVRPSTNPYTTDKDVAHFFSDSATSSFLVMRENNTITAAVLARNEIANTTNNTSMIDKLRNTVVGIGAALGLSNPQWKSLVNGLLNKN